MSKTISDLLARLQIHDFIFLNFIRSKVIRKERGLFIPYIKSIFILTRGSKIYLNGRLRTNDNCKKRNNCRSTIIRMDKNSILSVGGNFSIFYDGDIIIFENAKLELGSGFFNSNIKIRCNHHIIIGNNVAISHDVTIMDSDAHKINLESHEMTKPVIIGNNVWIGTRSTILKGVSIGNNSIIAAGSVVTRSIPDNSIAAGIPAKVIKQNISWN